MELLPAFYTHQSNVENLKDQIERAIDDFLTLGDMYSTSVPAVMPFSNWRIAPRTISADPAIRMAERLALSLETYIKQAQSYPMRRGRVFFKGDLFRGEINPMTTCPVRSREAEPASTTLPAASGLPSCFHFC